MLGIPLHPLVVHFPIVLSVLFPISVVVALWTIRKGARPRRAWAVPVTMAAALTASAYAAILTGQREEERVERVVTEDVISRHEESAERFLVLAGVVLLVAGAGLLPRTVGQAARLVTAAGALGLVAAGVQVGHSGGTLVYKHGAASAYTDTAGGVDAAPSADAVTPTERGARRSAHDESR